MLRYIALVAVCFAALMSSKAEAQVSAAAPLPCWWYESYPAYFVPKPPRPNAWVCLAPRYITACYDFFELKRDAFCARPGRWRYIRHDG